MNEYIKQVIKESVSEQKAIIARERRKLINKMLNYYQ